MNEKEIEWYDEVFDFIKDKHPDWERLLTEGQIKIKTNQHTVQFALIEEIVKKFNLRITTVSYTDFYGIIFAIEKI
ncbi:MAG: hypothetical protein IH792_01040 [Thaumarchaeota archaeon]|nr:hypothetical protein [Nitrososphaerota archaeon]